jgi:Ca2+-transporting ATPase
MHPCGEIAPLPPQKSRTRSLDALTGLSKQEAVGRLQQFGYNELPSAKPRTILQIAWGVLREPMLALLLGALIMYFLLGDGREASILGVFVFVVIGITLYQGRKTERALDALRDLSSPRALVLRDGERIRIPGREVVPGDLTILSEGDRVPADGFLLSAASLSIDESLLTGESVPVRKIGGAAEEEQARRPGGDDMPLVFSGTLVVRGSGIARAETTGISTELGKIGKSLEGLQSEPTLLQKDARRLIRVSTIIALFVCTLIAITYGLTRGDWLRGFLAALSTAMSLLPEELPVVLTIFLALGAWRISRLNVLTRRVPAIETLGAATVLCADKTGTLTMNQMGVRALVSKGHRFDVQDLNHRILSESLYELAEVAVLASRIDSADPMDAGIRRFGETMLAGTHYLHRDWDFIREYPLNSDLLALSEVWKAPGSDQAIIASKGAPEAVTRLCNLSPADLEHVLARTSELAAEGLRVLAVAKAIWNGDLPADQYYFAFELVGLVALADPVRPTVPAAIEDCRNAGIRVVMVTGDFAGTAVSIARQAGLGEDPAVITGPELAGMSDDSFLERAGTISVFARAVPDQKLRLVKALKRRGEIVAMTGDGVNDAPALKAAHIGVAMGRRGTDVAREAADLVLLDDDFSSIVQAVRMGRRIFDNLKKAIAYTFAVHVPIVGLSLIPVLLRWPLILAPVHIAFLELIIDPACSIVFEMETEEANIMRRPPRKIGERLFDRRTILLSAIQGVGVLLILLAVFAVALYRGQGEEDARALAFTSLVVANLALIQTNRSWLQGFVSTARSANVAMRWVTAGAVALLVLVLYLPPLRHVFGFSVLHPNDIALCIAAGLGSVAWFEALKAIARRHARRGAGSSV